MSSHATRTRQANSLKNMEVHKAWINTYSAGQNEPFYRLAFDYVLSVLNPPKGATITDLGCGTCRHAIRLARLGFQVKAYDFSGVVLEEARRIVSQTGLQDRIEIEQADVTSLRLPDDSCSYAICWGVLMHVPDVEQAIAEIARVIAPGGKLAVSEGNMRSLQDKTFRLLCRLGRRPLKEERTPAGVETWTERSSGALLVRHADIGWMISEFESHGLKLKKRVGGQFTELYTKVQAHPLNRCIHAFNNLCFRYLSLPRLAFGNILFFEKPL